MRAEIIVLPVIRIERCESNGAREALIEIFHMPEDVAAYWADGVLKQLWLRGFKVVPLEPTDEV